MATTVRRGEWIPGSGVSVGELTVVFGLTVLLFAFWGGPLWSAPRDASHVMRFAVSYLAAIPLVVALQARRAVHSWHAALTALGLVWAVKMLATAVLYEGLIYRRGIPSVPRPHGASAAATPARSYRAADGATFAMRAVSGRARSKGQPLAGAAVFLVEPAAGRALPTPGIPTIAIGSAGFDAPVYLARSDEPLRCVGRGGTLHTAHLRGERSSNIPLHPGAPPVMLEPLDPGVRLLGCDTHPAERAVLVVVDHPYATLTATDGGFTFDAAPADAHAVALVAVTEGGPLRLDAAIPASGALELDLEAAVPLSR